MIAVGRHEAHHVQGGRGAACPAGRLHTVRRQCLLVGDLRKMVGRGLSSAPREIEVWIVARYPQFDAERQ